MKLILEFLEFLEDRDRAEKLMHEFIAFLDKQKLQKVSITIEEPSQEVEFELTEEVFRCLEYGAYQLELPMYRFIEKVLEIEARKIKRNYCL